jgi:hypothetical protein
MNLLLPSSAQQFAAFATALSKTVERCLWTGLCPEGTLLNLERDADLSIEDRSWFEFCQAYAGMAA